MITLKDFVGETPVQIVQGASSAQHQLGDAAQVNPSKKVRKSKLNEGYYTTKIEHHPSMGLVEFEVESLAEDSGNAKKGGGIKLHVVSAGLERDSKK